jgi:hypothetical protein
MELLVGSCGDSVCAKPLDVNNVEAIASDAATNMMQGTMVGLFGLTLSEIVVFSVSEDPSVRAAD